MPSYYYKFDDGLVVEVNHSIHDDAYAELEHPETKETLPVTRVMQNPAGLILKGVGWATNDRKK